jgi:hypothetical protein
MTVRVSTTFLLVAAFLTIGDFFATIFGRLAADNITGFGVGAGLLFFAGGIARAIESDCFD